MRILALDLGVTTGWASLYRNKDGLSEVVASGTLSYAGYQTELKVILDSWEFDHIVVEMPLLIFRGQLRDQLENVTAWTMSVIGDRRRSEVYASDWKQTKFAKRKVARGLTTHERDACRMGMWFAEERFFNGR